MDCSGLREFYTFHTIQVHTWFLVFFPPRDDAFHCISRSAVRVRAQIPLIQFDLWSESNNQELISWSLNDELLNQCDENAAERNRYGTADAMSRLIIRLLSAVETWDGDQRWSWSFKWRGCDLNLHGFSVLKVNLHHVIIYCHIWVKTCSRSRTECGVPHLCHAEISHFNKHDWC